MNMYEIMNKYGFVEAFVNNIVYRNNFSYRGLEKLFEYLEDLEEDLGEKIEFDLIAIACEYTEYEDIKEFIECHNYDVEREDYDDEEDYKSAVFKYIRNQTTLIMINEENFIIRDY